MPRAQQMHLVPVRTMVDEALDFIRAHEPPEGYFVAFSGGKDSIVSLELVRMAGVRHQAFYSATGIDPPEVVQFIRRHYPDVKWLKPRRSFYDLIQTNDPPLRNQRWCCKQLKKLPGKRVGMKYHLLGIRAEESAKRAASPRVDWNRTLRVNELKPVYRWSEWQIWDFIEGLGRPYPSLYDEGWSRLGCVICPNHCAANPWQVDRNRQRWPGIFKAFEHAVIRWFDRKRGRHDKDFKSGQEYLWAWYHDFPSNNKMQRTANPCGSGTQLCFPVVSGVTRRR